MLDTMCARRVMPGVRCLPLLWDDSIKLRNLKGASMNTIPNEVIQRFAFKHNIPLSEASQLFGRLETFLDGASTCVSSPSPVIDEAWHEFILHTKYYADYCLNRYGRFIHHIPTSSSDCENECGTGVQEDFYNEWQERKMKVSDCSSDCSSGCRSN